MTAVRLGITGFIIPYFFLYNPLLLFQGESPLYSIFAGLTAAIGVVALAAALSNWFAARTSLLQRVLLLIGAFCMIWPEFYSDIAGIIIIPSIYLWQKISLSKVKKLSDSLGV